MHRWAGRQVCLLAGVLFDLIEPRRSMLAALQREGCTVEFFTGAAGSRPEMVLCCGELRSVVVAGSGVRRGWRAGMAALLAASPTGGLVACSDGDGGGSGVEGAALVDPFGKLAEELYEGGGRGPGDVPGERVSLLNCPVLTDDDAVAIAEALGLDDADRARADGVKILTDPEEESMHCYIDRGDSPEWVTVWTGTTTLTADNPEERVGGGAEVIDGEAPGLDDADVFGVDGPGVPMSVLWRDEGFQVVLSLPEGYDDADSAFRALALTVETIAGSLD